jgi:hypothetical protein
MHVHHSHAAFDVEAAIIKNGNVPSPVDLKAWQDRIDKIAGKTVEGRSRLRVVWGQSFDATSFILGRRRMRYAFWRYEGTHGEIEDIGTPRFYVEELHDMEELRKDNAWEKARYQWNELEKLDVLGPIPEEGFYTSVFLIAHHDELCCGGKGYVGKGDICLGAYRPPTDTDLTRIRRMKQRRDAAVNSENKPSGALIAKQALELREKRDEAFRKDIRERMDDWMRTHGHRLTDSMNPKIVKHGKYKPMPSTEFDGIALKESNASSSNSDRAAA